VKVRLTPVFHKTVVSQQKYDVGRSHIEIDMFQIQQSSKPHTRFHRPTLNTALHVYVGPKIHTN